MLTIVLLSLWLQAGGVARASARCGELQFTVAALPIDCRLKTGSSTINRAPRPETSEKQTTASARCADLFESADERVKPSLKISPGLPPLLNFRYFEGRMHQRFSGIDLT